MSQFHQNEKLRIALEKSRLRERKALKLLVKICGKDNMGEILDILESQSQHRPMEEVARKVRGSSSSSSSGGGFVCICGGLCVCECVCMYLSMCACMYYMHMRIELSEEQSI